MLYHVSSPFYDWGFCFTIKSHQKNKNRLLLHYFPVLEVMREGKFFNRLGFFLIITVFTLFLNEAISEEYIVGEDEEWNSQANFLSWSEKYNFSVGDVLVFKYVKKQHNVYEVEEEAFRSCDASSGVLAKYDSGNDRVKLTEAKKYWFLCNVDGHCLGGMRFRIDVKQSSTPSESTHSTNVSPSSQPNEIPATPPTSSSRGTLLSESWKTVIYVMAFGMLFNHLWYRRVMILLL